MRILSIIIACLLLLSANQKKIQQRKIIDVHFHAHQSRDYGKTPPPNPVTGKIPKWKNDKEVIDIMLATLKKNNVIKAIASGQFIQLSGIFIWPIPKDSFLLLIIPISKIIHFLIPLVLSGIFKRKNFVSLESLALQYEGKTLADPEFEPYLAICERMGIPVPFIQECHFLIHLILVVQNSELTLVIRN